MSVRMHADEFTLDDGAVAQRVAKRFPHWSGLTVTRVASAGTDNALFRLGDNLVVRMPRREKCGAQIIKDAQFLPRLAPHLPLAIPKPLAQAEPCADCPWPWAVYAWLPGEMARADTLGDPIAAADALAAFICALRAIEATGAPSPSVENFGRGAPLATRDKWVRAAIVALGADIDAAACLRVWDDACAAPVYSGAPVWLHGDLQAGNLLTRDGRLAAVIDFGGLAAADPACDLMPAWTLFDGPARARFRAAIGADEGEWRRARGWALSVALIAMPYYRDTNPTLVAASQHAVSAVLAEFAATD